MRDRVLWALFVVTAFGDSDRGVGDHLAIHRLRCRGDVHQGSFSPGTLPLDAAADPELDALALKTE
jgi:hypothetical protein